MCDILVDLSLPVVAVTTPVSVGPLLSLWPVAPPVLQQRTWWFLSSCVGQWCSLITGVCGGLVSRYGVQAPLSLWPMVNTVVVAKGSV